MAYELLPAEKEEIHLCFRLSGEGAERCGAIGYLRADFGRSGKEFYTTWFDNQAHLKSSDFKYKFDALINSLRDDGQKPPFASRDNHLAFCAANPSMTAFKITTLDYSFYFRLNPNQGTYDIYCFTYDNRYLLPELAGQHKLPNNCFAILPSSGEAIFIVYGEKGYHPSGLSTNDKKLNRQTVDLNNALMGVTRAQQEAMLAGSLFGWDKPAAKPWNYDQSGNPRLPNQPKKNDMER
ncbi:MAG: hypothetical protein PHV32_14635 [Eubacteriales bacterium]|nr:hypothetical protein [Eubacteriales bacterium]